MNSSLLQQLREQTRPAHLALENQPLLKSLLSTRLTETEYGRILRSMLAFYQSLELKLVPATAGLLRRHPDPDYRYSPRAPLLSEDCRALGCASPELIHPPIELHLDGREAGLLGVLYVIEGSTQGGRFIARHLADTLGLDEHSGARFFNLHRWSDSWMAFRHWVDRELAYNDQDEINSVIEGANMTFSALHTHFDQCLLLTDER